MFRVFVAIVVMLGVFGSARGSAAQSIEEPTGDRLPSNVQIYEMFRPVVQSMIEQSPTLQQQCRIIAASRHVRIVIQARAPEGTARARASITRHEAGALRATIVLPISQDLAELLAHELEHVIEQIEGVDLAALARSDSSLARRDHQGVYETARATRVGQDAVGEIEIRQAEAALARREARAAAKAGLRRRP